MLMNLLPISGRVSLDVVTPGMFENISGAIVTTNEPGYVVVYVDNQTIGKDVWFDNVQVLHYNTRVLEENHYYPFGLTLSNSAIGITEQPLKYNGKELDKSFGLEYYNYGARQFDPQRGQWAGVDPLADKYYPISPFAYVANNPINAIDPDGRLIIFINGNHFGDGADKYYAYNRKAGDYRFTGTWDYWRRGSNNFDLRVMIRLNDTKAIYRDGAMGGFFGLSSDNPISINSPYGRDKNGYIQDQEDAATIVRLLDKGETIKVITHSMGGAYGKGYVRALKEYIATLPQEQQSNVLISLVADFDPHQANSLSADENIYTQQFSHKSGKGRKSSDNMGWLANQTEKGIDYYNEDNKDSSHSIFTFMKNISELKEGTYKWNGKEWICQTCK